MEQEKELLHGQTSWLNEELKAKSEELLSLSRQRGNEILELKCNLENKEDEACLFVNDVKWHGGIKLWWQKTFAQQYFILLKGITLYV